MPCAQQRHPSKSQAKIDLAFALSRRRHLLPPWQDVHVADQIPVARSSGELLSGSIVQPI